MATLAGTKIADTYDSLLHVEDNTAGLVATSTDSRVIQDGVGANSALALATDSVRITSTNKLYFNDVGGEYISGDGTDLTITSGADIILTAGSYVGLGTTSPAKLLHISGAADNTLLEGVQIDNTDHGGSGAGETGQSVAINMRLKQLSTMRDAGRITVGKDDDWDDAASTDSHMSFKTMLSNTLTEHMRINSAGKVGIGQTTINAMLDIDDGASGSGIGVPQIRVGSINNTGVYGQIGFGWGGNTTYSPVTIGGLGTSGSGSVEADFVINTRDGTSDAAPSERMRVTHDGKVGIGTSSPDTILDVRQSSDGAGAEIKIVNTAGTGSSDETVELTAQHTTSEYVGGKIQFFRSGDYSTTGQRQGGIKLYTCDNNSNAVALTLAKDLSATFSGAGSFTKVLSSDTQTTPETVLTLSTKYSSTGADGGAGAGTRLLFKLPDDTANPSVGASIDAVKENADDAVSSTSMVFSTSQDDETLDEAMRITSDGKVGIGDTSPESYLDIEFNTVTSSASLNNLNTSMIITGGGSDSGDNYYGQYNYLGFNHSGSYYGELNGGGFWAVSDTTSGGEGTSITGGIHHAEMKGGTDVNNIRGSKVLTDIDAGTIDSSAYGIINQVDMESGVGGSFDVYGYFSSVDSDTDRPTYSHYHESYNNVDYHWVGYSATVPSITWRISAAGQIQAEGSIDASASLDYAEYFESKDGKAIAVGTTVKLDGDKIVACEDGDTPIGVIRPLGASGVVGGSQHFHWQSKFEKDDYDGLVMEDFTWTKWKEEISFDEYKVRGQEKTSTDDGSAVTLKSTVPIKAVKYQSGEELPEGKKVGDIKTEAIPSKYYRVHKYHTDRIPSDVTAPSDANVIPSGNKRPKLNSSYDSSKAESYKSREERDEWCIVGLLGQIPITKGQPLASNWIKMKDVSDTVEMYFVK